MHCTQCGAEAQGKFCGPCGASLVPLPCPSCRAGLPAGTRYCTDCGSPARLVPEVPTPVPATRGPQFLPWALSALLLVALLVVGGFGIFAGNGGPGVAPPPGTLGPAPNVDLASMSPGEAADRLFNRVAMALQVRDSIEVMSFLPMALDAHELAAPLSAVRLFRYSFLQRVATEYETALRLAREGLERDPDHLLLLSAAAEAARELGDRETALQYFQHLLDVWDVEAASGSTDYAEHERLLPILREDAQTFVSGG
jgi:hypothetical protein